jgi:hypothetical protein
MPVCTAVVYKVPIIPYFRLAREFAKDGEHAYTDKLKRIQCILMDISASILKSPKPEQQVQLSARHTKDLEEWIEEYSCQLPPLEKYVIPVSLFVSLVMKTVDAQISAFLSVFLLLFTLQNKVHNLADHGFVICFIIICMELHII